MLLLSDHMKIADEHQRQNVLQEYAISKKIFKKTYKKIGELGVGAFATVYEYANISTKAHVAVKILCNENSVS